MLQINREKIVKRFALGCVILICCFSVLAQNTVLKIPPFRILGINGKIFKAEDLPFGRPVVVIYFSPECDHCISFAREFLKQTSKLKNASVVWITYEDVSKVQSFVKQFSLTKYRNFYVGTEGNGFFVRNYYGLSSMPFVAMHRKNGDLVRSYERDIPLKELISAIGKLN